MSRASATTAELPASPAEPIRLDQAEQKRLTKMCEETYDVVFRVLRRLGLDPTRAEDGAQQVYLIAAKRLSTIHEGKERSFLIGTAVNVAHRLRRERQHVKLPSDPPQSGGTAGADELVDQKRQRELLDRLLAEMEDDLRVVLVLAEVEGYGKREIADALDVPEGTVASRLRRAREDFLGRLKRHRAKEGAR